MCSPLLLATLALATDAGYHWLILGMGQILMTSTVTDDWDKSSGLEQILMTELMTGTRTQHWTDTLMTARAG